MPNTKSPKKQTVSFLNDIIKEVEEDGPVHLEYILEWPVCMSYDNRYATDANLSEIDSHRLIIFHHCFFNERGFER